jgi:ubiquinone/menaquinone biosynthesis C-methylase UbiE
MALLQTAERQSAHLAADNPVYQRHLVAYHHAAQIISGNVLEIGCGEGYGIPLLAPHCTQYTAIDKYTTNLSSLPPNAKFIQTNVPELPLFADNTFDYVVSFQVIEHIQNDHIFLKEIHRVLKPNGKLLFTTPNAAQSLTRNPFHTREYTVAQMAAHTHIYFNKFEHLGIFGNEKMMDYHEKNRKSVQKITRFDVFDLQHKLPRNLLQIPYNIANRLNRYLLNNQNQTLVSDITTHDFYIAAATPDCLDHFVVATKNG